MPATFQLGAVILAAGASSRMGRPKLLLPWNGTTVLQHLLLQWVKFAGGHVAVVCAPANTPITAELDRLNFPSNHTIINPNPERGMFSSIIAAARWGGWQDDVTHIAISLGDQPHLTDETLRQLIDFATAHPAKICQPSRSGRARHPVILPCPVFRELPSATAQTLKEFLDARAKERACIEIEDPGLGLDLDTPADYEAALNLQSIRDQRQ